MPKENKTTDKSKVEAKNYEEFKAKREEEKKARQKRIEDRLQAIRLKRFVGISSSARKESRNNLISTKSNNKTEHKILRPIQNTVSKTSDKLTSLKTTESVNNNKTLNANVLKRKFENVASNKKSVMENIPSKAPRLTSEANVPKVDAEARKKKLELWKTQRIERVKQIESRKKKLGTQKVTSVKVTDKQPVLKKPISDVTTNKKFNPVPVKKSNPVSQSSKVVDKQKPAQKRISLSSKHFAGKTSKATTKNPVDKATAKAPISAKQPRTNTDYFLDFQGKKSTVKPGGVDLIKSHMKDKLNKWLENKGKSPSTCKRHMSCYGLYSSTPIGGRVRLQVKSAMKHKPKKEESLIVENTEPVTESKVRMRRLVGEIQDCNIFRSSHVLLKCREINQKSGFLRDDDTLLETPLRKFIVTPVRRSTRKSCVPISLKEHDILVETVDELSAEVKQLSIFKPNKCLAQPTGDNACEPVRKQLKFDDNC